MDVIWEPRKKLWWGHPRDGTERAVSAPPLSTALPDRAPPAAGPNADPRASLPAADPLLLTAPLVPRSRAALLPEPPWAPAPPLPDSLLCFLAGREECELCSSSSSSFSF